MASPWAVLVVPAESRRIGRAAHPLLSGHAVLGGEPPMAWRKGGEWQAPWDQCDTGPLAVWPDERALPLWWDGALVPEGFDRARRVVGASGAWWGIESVREGASMARFGGLIVGAGFASRVVLLDLVDGRLVEVPCV